MSKNKINKPKYIPKALRKPVPKHKKKINKVEKIQKPTKKNPENQTKGIDICLICDLTESNKEVL